MNKPSENPIFFRIIDIVPFFFSNFITTGSHTSAVAYQDSLGELISSVLTYSGY